MWLSENGALASYIAIQGKFIYGLCHNIPFGKKNYLHCSYMEEHFYSDSLTCLVHWWQ